MVNTDGLTIETDLALAFDGDLDLLGLRAAPKTAGLRDKRPSGGGETRDVEANKKQSFFGPHAVSAFGLLWPLTRPRHSSTPGAICGWDGVWRLATCTGLNLWPRGGCANVSWYRSSQLVVGDCGIEL
jgi:hypothetical protein